MAARASGRASVVEVRRVCLVAALALVFPTVVYLVLNFRLLPEAQDTAPKA